MLRFETSLSPAECMQRILTVADINSPTAPIGGKQFLCVMNADRFRLSLDKTGSRRRGLTEVHFDGRLRSSTKGTIIEGRFPGLPPWAIHVLVWCVITITFWTRGSAQPKLNAFPWMDLLVLSSCLAVGSFIVSFASANIRHQEETILRLLEALFGKPAAVKNETTAS